MAENKKSFILYADLIHTVRKMPKGKQAELFMAILGYVNDENPEVSDLLVSIAWEPIKLQLKRDLSDWREKVLKKSEGGKKGMESRWKNITKDNIVIEKITPITDTVTVNDTVTVTVNDIDTRNEKFETVNRIFLQNSGTKEMARAFFNTHESTEWKIRGTPIVNPTTLIQNYINNWNKNLQNGTAKTHSGNNGIGRSIEFDKA